MIIRMRTNAIILRKNNPRSSHIGRIDCQIISLKVSEQLILH